MSQGSTSPTRSASALRRRGRLADADPSFAPFGADALADVIRVRVREVIEATVNEELDTVLGVTRYGRDDARRGYRNGHVERTLGTTVGTTTLELPRARLFALGGRTTEWRPSVLRRYQRRMAAVDNAVVGAYVAGANTRRLRGALRPLLKDVPLSRSAVSRLVTRLKGEWEQWRDRPLGEERFVFLYLDGFAVKVRVAGRVTGMPILAIVGVKPDGTKALVALDLAGGESEEAWRGLLDRLVARGLRAPELCVTDGCPGLSNAIRAVWKDVDVQRCAVHKLRNLLAKAPKHAHDAVRDDFHAIVYADDEAAARKAYAKFEAKWSKRCQRVVDSLREAGDELLTFFRYPAAQRKCLRTTNVIERVNEEFRRRVKTQTSLPTEDAALVLLWALVASGHVRMRRVDGWEAMAELLDRVITKAA